MDLKYEKVKGTYVIKCIIFEPSLWLFDQNIPIFANVVGKG